MDLRAELGNLDIYLFDQIHRGLIEPGARVLDAGCGRGRNLTYFLRQGHEVWANDSSSEALAATVERVRRELGDVVEGRFRLETIEEMSFEDESFDLVICNAVLHFARDLEQFALMTKNLRDVLRPGGRLFCRLATTIGMPEELPAIEAKAEGWRRNPDGTEFFLVDLPILLARTESLGLELADPIKTVNVQNRRCMTTWVTRRN